MFLVQTFNIIPLHVHVDAPLECIVCEARLCEAGQEMSYLQGTYVHVRIHVLMM